MCHCTENPNWCTKGEGGRRVGEGGGSGEEEKEEEGIREIKA